MISPTRRAILLLYTILAAAALHAQEFDVILAGGRVVDGSGNAWYHADIGIRDGRIAAIGPLSGRTAKRTISTDGKVVSPGFIDMMGATSVPLLTDRASAESKLRQGIVTILAGEGASVAPQKDGRWRTFGEYFQILERNGIPLNVVHNVGAAQVRRLVVGEENRAPTPSQLAEMRAHVEEAMRDGAVGLSTALIYPPGTYATTEELVELAKVVGRYGGAYFTHMRNESHQLLDAIRESIHIGEQAGIPVHIFHLKAAGHENWPRLKDALQLIQRARDRGLDVTADIYPYIRNGLGIGSLIHPRHYAQGSEPFLKTLKDPKIRTALRKEIETTSDWENWYRHVGQNWDNILVAHVGPNTDQRFEGKSVVEIAKLRSVDPWTAFFDLVEQGGVSVNPKSMDEEQKRDALRAEWVSVCTDSEPLNIATATGAHPRAFGSFARILAKYVREERVISLEAAVRKMSSLPANALQLHDRGRIAPGMAADLLVFDPARVDDTATFTKPLSFPVGIDYVLVNGRLAIDNGRFTEEDGGAVLRLNTTRTVFLKLLDRPRAPLAPEIKETPVTDGLAQMHFSFASEASQRVPGILVKPANESTPRRPVVISLHGTGGNKEGQLELLKDLAHKGFVGVAIDGRYHGERSKAGSGAAEYQEAILRAWRAGKEHPFLYDTVWDVMRLIDYLQTRPDVDPHHIGLIGFSKGGMETYLAAAVDNRIRVAVPCIGVQSFRWGLDNNEWQGRVRTIQAAVAGAAKESGLAGPDPAFVRQFYDRVVPGIYAQFDGPAMLPLIAPRPLLVINGDSDDHTPRPGLLACAAAAERAYQEAGAQDKFVLLMQEKTGHRVQPASRQQAIDWFVKWLQP